MSANTCNLPPRPYRRARDDGIGWRRTRFGRRALDRPVGEARSPEAAAATAIVLLIAREPVGDADAVRAESAFAEAAAALTVRGHGARTARRAGGPAARRDHPVSVLVEGLPLVHGA